MTSKCSPVFKAVRSSIIVCISLFSGVSWAQTISRCEVSLTQKPVAETIEICREELTAPLTRDRRVAVLESLGKAYLAQQEPNLALVTWNEASQYLSPSRTNPQATEQWSRLQVLIAQTYFQLNEPEKAKEQFLRTIARIDKEVGRYSVAGGFAQDALGAFYALQNQVEPAEEAFKRSRIIHEVRLGKFHPKTIETRMNHAVGLLDMNQEDKAKEHFLVLAEIINARPEFDSEPIKAEIVTFLGTLQMRQDDLVNAAKNYQMAFEVRQNAFGPDDVRTSQSLNNLGVVLYRAGDLVRAEQALSRAYVIRRDALGEKDSLTTSTQKNLQAVIAAQNAAKSPPRN